MMEAESVESAVLRYARLIAQDDLFIFNRLESFKSYSDSSIRTICFERVQRIDLTYGRNVACVWHTYVFIRPQL